MKRLLGISIVLILVLATSSEGIAGPGNRTGTGGAAQLLVPVGARDLAMGGSTISTTKGIESLFWNPAGVAKSDNSANIIFSHMSYIADIGVEYGAVSGRFGWHRRGDGSAQGYYPSASMGNRPTFVAWRQWEHRPGRAVDGRGSAPVKYALPSAR